MPRHCQDQTQIDQLIPPLTSPSVSWFRLTAPGSRVSLPNMAPRAKGPPPDGRGRVSAASRIIVPLTSRLIAPHQRLQMLHSAKQDQLTSGQRGCRFDILLCPTVALLLPPTPPSPPPLPTSISPCHRHCGHACASRANVNQNLMKS